MGVEIFTWKMVEWLYRRSLLMYLVLSIRIYISLSRNMVRRLSYYWISALETCLLLELFCTEGLREAPIVM